MNPSETSSPQTPPDFDAATNGGSAEGSPGSPVTKARRAAGKAVDQAKEKVAQVATDQKATAADKIGGYSERLRATARTAEEQEDPNIAHFTNQAADRLESVANYVRDADFSRLRDDAAGVARRHPALFMGGMLVAGLVLGNLAKASVQGLQEDQAEPDDNDETTFEATEDDFAMSGSPAAGAAPTDAITESFNAVPNRNDVQF